MGAEDGSPVSRQIEDLLCDSEGEPINKTNKESVLFAAIQYRIQQLEGSGTQGEKVPVNRCHPFCHIMQWHRRLAVTLIIMLLILVVVIKYICYGKSLRLCWSNTIQDLIYPVLRIVRLSALPLINSYPAITDTHEETCLVENPLYQDTEVDCTLCQGVSVITAPHVEQFEDMFYHKGAPLIIQDAIRSPVDFSQLSALYQSHRSEIVSGSGQRLTSTGQREPRHLDQLLMQSEQHIGAQTDCVEWKLLRVSAVRHLRKLFRRPYFVPKKTEVSLHRYIYLCGHRGDPFELPVTEFANVWVGQYRGARHLQLLPSSECAATCRPVSALLQPGDTLFYNWRYWRPVSLPVETGTGDNTLETGTEDKTLETGTGDNTLETGTGDKTETAGVTFVGSFY